MSTYTHTRKSSMDVSDDRQQNTRRSQLSQLDDADCNVNGNNNTDDSNKSSLPTPDTGRRFSNSKSPARNRKSKLIETMAANFEKKNSENPGVKTSARRSAPNGDAKIAPMIVEPTDDSKNDLGDDASKSTSEEKKVGPSGRRGKGQRGKRMLRQKRRSTGVVNKEDLEDIEPTNTTEAEENLQKETDVNTQTNELSPASAYSSDRLSVDDHNSVSNRSEHSNGSTKEIQDTPRRNTDKHASEDKNSISMASESELLELKEKLEAAESTITRLRQEIKIMDKELHVLEDENDQLRKDNKMLEDENRTMLRIMKNRQ